MNTLYKFFSIAIFGIFLSACGTNATPAQDTYQNLQSPNNNNNNNNNQSTLANEIIFIQSADPPSLDPQNNNDTVSSEATSQMFERLTTINEYGNAVGQLAEYFHTIDDYTWEFILRSGVYFHDGTYFNSYAVKVTLDRLLDEENASVRAFMLNVISEVVIIDDYTVHIITEAPFGPLPTHLAHHAGKMISPYAIALELNGGPTIAENPIGTGPFKLLSRSHGAEVRFTRFENYWGVPAATQYLTFVVVPEPATRLAMLESGGGHITNIQPQDVGILQNTPGIEVIQTPINRMEYLGFNTMVYPFDNQLVRQALTMAVNKEDILYGIADGMGTIAHTAIAPGVFASPTLDQLTVKEFNMDMARQLLAEAGYPDGFETTLLIGYGNTVRQLTAEYLQASFAQIGVSVEIQLMEWGAFLDTIDAGEHEMYLLGWTTGTGDPDHSIWPLYHSSTHGPFGNTVFHTNPIVDELLEKGRSTLDLNLREQIYLEISQILIDTAARVYLFHPFQQMGVSSSVGGFFIENGTPRFHLTYIIE